MIKQKHLRGFTIVELLIVIVVIAILAAISIVAYNGIQQRARLSQIQTANVQMQKSLELFKAETDNYPSSISSCPTPTTDAACLAIPSGYTVSYVRFSAGTRPSPVFSGTASEQNYELTLRSDTSVIYRSNAERTGTNEFLQYMNMAPIIDQYGLKQYQISFDIKSANPSPSNAMNVYMQNGSGAKYTFSINVPVTSSYERRTITVTPSVWNDTMADSVLAFYGAYNTGNIPSVKNLEIVRVN